MPRNVNKRRIFKMDCKKITAMIKEKAEKSNIKLTSKSGLFAINLFEYALKNGTLSNDEESYWLLLTVDEIAETLGYSKTFVTETLIKFTKADIVQRKRFVSEKGNKTNTKVTVIDTAYFCRA